MSEIPNGSFPTDHERVLPTPIMTIRPHRLFHVPIINAILGCEPTIKQYADGFNECQSNEYLADTFGDTVESISHLYSGLISIQKKLSLLDDEDWIEVSIKRDLVCQSCAIGAHCVAQNYTLSDYNPNTINDELLAEILCVRKLTEDLESTGSSKNRDFFEINSVFQINYYSGNSITSGIYTTYPTDFQYLLVRVGALRTALDPDGAIRAQLQKNTLSLSQS